MPPYLARASFCVFPKEFVYVGWHQSSTVERRVFVNKEVYNILRNCCYKMSESYVQRTPINGSEGSCVDMTVKSLFSNLGISSNTSTEMVSIDLSYKYLTEKEVRVLARGMVYM